MAREDTLTESRPTISTHVLDAARGVPAAGVRVRLHRIDDSGEARLVAEATTDADGRIRSLGSAPLEVGCYRLELQLQPPGSPGAGGGFFETVRLDLRIDDATRSYHVPLLVAPYAVTAYRGS
jgi:5-hydroxyisourate hydrolase